MNDEYFRTVVNRCIRSIKAGRARRASLDRADSYITWRAQEDVGRSCHTAVRDFHRDRGWKFNSNRVYFFVAYAELFTEYRASGNVPMYWTKS